MARSPSGPPMTAQLATVLALLGLAIGMFVTGRPRTDVVALLMLLLLPLTGTVTVPEALAGFGDASVLLVAALFVVGEGLVRTLSLDHKSRRQH
ncbi:SLC13 family permease, partial [Roseomonas sp. TAS13]|uniref:SLC13 family permease n=1 Tax=Roseomonas sp. TAS13 TaxID=1926319 RepID=UPI00352B0791